MEFGEFLAQDLFRDLLADAVADDSRVCFFFFYQRRFSLLRGLFLLGGDDGHGNSNGVGHGMYK